LNFEEKVLVTAGVVVFEIFIEVVYFIYPEVAILDYYVSLVSKEEFNGASLNPFAKDFPIMLHHFTKTIDS
jgi:hypothetical protein